MMTTPRQRELLRYIAALSAKGFPPTIRELTAVMGVKSTNALNDVLKAVQRKGFVIAEPRAARTIRLTDAGRREMGMDR